MSKPDWRKAHQKVYELCYKQERADGWPHEIADKRARERATKSSERAINAYQKDYKVVSKSNPGWSQEQIDREVRRLQEMKYIHDSGPSWWGKLKHIRWLVDGEEVLKVE